MKPSKDKKVFVLWSGGLDSTYLIFKLLEEGYSVDAGYIEVLNNEEKILREEEAMARISLIFSEKYKNFSYLGVIYKCFVNKYGNVVLNYPIIFINSLYGLKDYEEVYIGYVMNDDAISWLSEFKSLWSAYKPFVEHLPKLKFPLIKTKKTDIWHALPEELRNLVTWCESPIKEEKRNCGHCAPCKKMLYLGLEKVEQSEKQGDMNE